MSHIAGGILRPLPRKSRSNHAKWTLLQDAILPFPPHPLHVYADSLSASPADASLAQPPWNQQAARGSVSVGSKFFSILFSARNPLRALAYQCHACKYPAISMCAVDYKCMIGAYKPLLVMYLVNPWLSALGFTKVVQSCLSHVTASIEHPNPVLDRWRSFLLQDVGILL